MEFRKSTSVDIPDIMKIIRDAQENLRLQNIDQWQNHYPNEATIEEDIKKSESYVLCDERSNKIIGTAAVSFLGEETYEHIYDGKWNFNDPYGVIHRIAVHKEYLCKGIASLLLFELYQLALDSEVYYFRIDTHKENIPMQKLLKKHHFIPSGIIYTRDGGERIAFEKCIKESSCEI